MSFGRSRGRKERIHPGSRRRKGVLQGKLEYGLEGLTLVDARNGFNELSH
jgi:hypothetical protein